MSDRPPNNEKRNLVESFDALALAGGRRRSDPPPPSQPPVRRDVRQVQNSPPAFGGFVGGFRPPPPPNTTGPPNGPPYQRWVPPPQTYAAEALPLPRPPAMPKPHHTAMSLTMQHAVDLPPPPPPRKAPGLAPPFSPPPPPPKLPSSPHNLAPPTPPARPRSDPPARIADPPRTPQPAKLVPPRLHHRAQSEPVSPTSNRGGDTTPLQCSGITAAGNRCRNTVKVTGARADAGGDVFCHAHERKMHEPSGFYDRKTGAEFIKFEDWIPTYLQPSTQASLRSEMQKARSDSDVHGYIYTFEILDPTEKKVVHLKVGRATNLNRRMDQWGKQCGSKEQVLRGFWPGGVLADTTLMKSLLQAGPKGPWCHRLERLVHIELADLAANTPYLDPDFPNVVASAKSPAPKADVKRCPDCGKAHKEIFSFERAAKGRYKGKEWEDIVKPVIEKWGGFVQAFL